MNLTAIIDSFVCSNLHFIQIDFKTVPNECSEKNDWSIPFKIEFKDSRKI